MTFDLFQKLLSFLAGLALVIGGTIDKLPRIAAVAIGLLLMGVFTVQEALAMIRGKDVNNP